MRRASGLVVGALLPYLFAALLGCSDGPPAPAATESGSTAPDLADVVYQFGATDEGLRVVVGTPPVVDDARSPSIAEPGIDDQAYAVVTPPTFTWSAVAVASPTLRQEVWDALDEGLGVRSASAHGDPHSGNVYFVTFAAPNGPLLRVFTTRSSYAPTADEWSRIAAGGAAVSLRVVGAVLENNALVKGGGPFGSSSARRFSVRP